MNLEETTAVLAKAAAFDQRTIGEADVLAWHEAIGDLYVDHALAAVTRHFRESDARLMPVHIRRIDAEMAKERARLAIAAASSDESCEHGQPGGKNLHPTTGKPMCPLCRRAADHG